MFTVMLLLFAGGDVEITICDLSSLLRLSVNSTPANSVSVRHQRNESLQRPESVLEQYITVIKVPWHVSN